MKDTFNSFRFVTTAKYNEGRWRKEGTRRDGKFIAIVTMQSKRRSARVIVDSKGGLHGAHIIGLTTVNAIDQ